MRIRQHVNPLKSDFFRIPLAPLEIPQGAEVEVELGSAEAHFLMERAGELSGVLHVGVEIRRDRVEQANLDCAKRGLGNVRSVFANMSVDLPRLFAPTSVRRFFLNFPDPWFKARQHKRRVICPELMEALHGLLAPGGEVYVATDIFALAMDAMAELEAEPPRRFVNLEGPWSFLRRSPVVAKSRRERQCDEEGARIWRLGFRRA